MLGISPEKRFLPQVMLEVHSIILSTTSRTLLRQTYTNPSATAAIPEATYRFPLYDGVSVVAFACRVGSRLISGVVKEKEKAKAVYDAARGRGETAGLFEQLPEASDVFTTRLGNIPAGSDVVVEIEYLGELKHDAQVDGIRFTIPTAIAARYGTLPQDLRLPDGSPAREDGGIRITVDVCMDSSSSIRGIQSPSHPISVSLGSLSTDAEDSAQEVSLSRASATLSQGSAELEKDFVLLVLCKDVATPKALLETHPTIPGQRALMVTLVPRFALPPSRPEIVFVADRSGSMRSNIPTLISALKVFLKSLPVGVKFNICSFGSSFTFLWPRSKTYDRSSLTEAVKHVEGFQADYGGTEILRPVQAALERRFMDLSLEVMLLTDGETWDQASLFQYLNKEVIGTRAPIRVFSLGIGSDVSHAFIEGIARAGNGFSQAVSEDERLDGKVVRMLKGGLSPHINDYNLEVKYEASGSEDGYEMVERVTDGLQSMMIDDAAVDPSQHQARDKPISLFDSTANPDGSPGADEADRMDVDGSARFSHLPDLRVPKLVQAPHRIPALFPFSRTVVYLLLSADACQKTPKSVVLRATSAHGPLELEMAVEVLDTPQETIHQLAARKLVGELEEGRGWIVEAKDEGGVPIKERFEGQFDDMVQREAVRLGVEFQVAGKWCSFVAVEVDEQALAEQARRAEEAKRKEAVTRPTPGNVFSGGQRPGRGPAGTGDALSSQASEDLDDGRSVASSAISTGTFVSDATAPVQTPSSRSRQSNLSSASLKESLRGIGNENR
ncbi:MAG: hypothetical protein M1832_005473 [Thelocarpon impressellum]|nr:MAG: hypothetical protein M1832_005473 [Thelocarpon impressellum]